MGSGGSMKRMQVLFSGRVQGVGFRYTICHFAVPFEVVGFVQNLPDGDVLLVVEGVEQELVDFLGDIRSSHVGRYVTRELVHWEKATGEYDRFGVSY
jgi:acylphosphatase